MEKSTVCISSRSENSLSPLSKEYRKVKTKRPTLQNTIFFFIALFVTPIAFASASEKTREPQRIVSCSVASDEILLQILQNTEKRKRLLAVSTLADNPQFNSLVQEARTVPHRVGANIEQVLALKPDLVIAASFNQPEFVSLLRKLKLKVHVMDGFQSLNDLKRHVLQLGSLVGAEKEAQDLVDTMMKELLDLKKQNTFAKKILPLFSDRTLIGKDTLLDDVLSFVGFRNLAKDLGIVGWQKVSEEKLLQLTPDWLLTSAEEKERNEVFFTLSQSPALRKMKALDKKKLLLVSPSLMSSFSPRIVSGVKTMKDQMLRLEAERRSL